MTYEKSVLQVKDLKVIRINYIKMEDMYECQRCGYSTTDITNFRRHLTRKVACPPKLSQVDILTLQKEYIPEKKEKNLVCSCGKSFASRSGLCSHKKKCATPEQVEQNTFEAMKVELKDTIKKEIMQELAGTSNNIVVNNNNNTTNINNNLVINVNNFGGETYDHITPDFVKTCLMNNVPGLKSLVEKIHFSDDTPCNRNVRHKSFKNKLVEVMKDNKWVVKDAHETADTMIKKGCRIMTRHYFEDEEMQDTDLNVYDQRIQQSLLQMNDRGNPQYFDCRKRILALIAEYT